MPVKTKVYGVSAICLLLLIFIGRTQYEYKITTNTIQYSAFGGWQMAANALYGYAHAKPDDLNSLPGRFRQLHAVVNHHVDSLRQLIHRPDDEIGIYYLWDFESPLVSFFVQQNNNDKSTSNYFRNWASIAPLYQDYGRWLAMKHPREFIQYYIWPNLIRYYSPPEGFMGYYNVGMETVDNKAKKWFSWKSNQLPLRSKDRIIHVTAFFPGMLSVLNPVFLFAVIFFLSFNGYNNCNPTSKKILGMLLFVWLSNTAFSIFSAPIELRYQLFPTMITLAFCGLLIGWIIESLQTQSDGKRQATCLNPLPS